MTLTFTPAPGYAIPIYRMKLSAKPENPAAYLICKAASTWTAQFVNRRGDVHDVIRFADSYETAKTACELHVERVLS
jgi:hypothetical protein